jgi:hypothetical protein
MRKLCPINMDDFLGDFDNTNETFGGPYGPYTTSVSAVTPTGATTARITVENIWDNGWGPIDFDVDWTDSENPTVTVVAQDPIPGSDAGDFNPAYAGIPANVRPFAAGPVGTFSACDNTLTLKMQLGVSGLGYFPNIYTVIMER